MRPACTAASLRPSLPFAILLATAACTSLPSIGPDTPLEDGLSHYGRVLTAPPGDAVRVVVMKDRHTTHGGITRSRDMLHRVRRENHCALAYLLDKGFDLLGCEAPLGPLPRDSIATAHRAAVLKAQATADDLDALTVYQPIRFEEEFKSRLLVLGVEDPDLYDADARRLMEVIRLGSLAARNDLDDGARAQALREVARLEGEITAQSEERGRRAAGNLLDLMKRHGRARAVLLLGGSHTGAALEVFERAAVPALLFECRSYHGS